MLVVGSATRGTKTRLHKKRHIFWFLMIVHLFLFPAVYFGLPVYLLWDSDPSKFKVRGGDAKEGGTSMVRDSWKAQLYALP